ncbi:MAG: hypothetical protein NTW03_00185 [Verrucomicrobia bacterium]|nr:hypothetical protein [Verrucomicrobiota bacterium]
MKADDVRKIAEAFIMTQEMRGFVPKFADARKSVSWPDSWTVNFELRSPSGGLVDGGVMVIVDAATGKARFFDSL